MGLLTYGQIAIRYGYSAGTVQRGWSRMEGFPEPVERGRPLRFDEDEVAAFVAARIRPPGPDWEGADDELVTIGEVTALTGRSADSVWSMIGHGYWPRPVGRRRKRNAAGEPTGEWESFWLLGEVRLAHRGPRKKRS